MRARDGCPAGMTPRTQPRNPLLTIWTIHHAFREIVGNGDALLGDTLASVGTQVCPFMERPLPTRTLSGMSSRFPPPPLPPQGCSREEAAALLTRGHHQTLALLDRRQDRLLAARTPRQAHGLT